MSSPPGESTLVDVILRPAFVLGLLLIAAIAYSLVVVQSLGPVLQGAWVLLTAFVVWLLYRLVVAVEDLAGTARRIETSIDDE